MTVYVVQVPERRNALTNVLEPLFDLRPAREFGDLEVLLESSAKPFASHEMLNILYGKLSGYDGEHDYILCTGNPILIGMATAVAFDCSPTGLVSWLQWSRAKKSYTPVRANFESED